MITAGIDIGSRTTKVIILDGNKTVAKEICSTGWKPTESAEKVFSIALESANILKADIKKIIATGYGRIMLPFADETVTEITHVSTIKEIQFR